VVPHFYLNLSKNFGSNVLFDFVSINPLFQVPRKNNIFRNIFPDLESMNILQLKKMYMLHCREIKG